MKKNVLKILIVSLIIFLLGAVICSAALIYASSSDIDLFDNPEVSAGNSFEINIKNIENTGVSRFSALDIRAEKSDVKILPTQKESYVYFENPDNFKTTAIIENGVLKITDSVPFYVMGISFENGKMGFAGFRNVFTNGLYSHTEKSITIYLNDNDIVGNVKVSLGVGNVDIEGVEIKKLTATSSVGNVTLRNSTISETAEVSVKTGDIVLKDTSYVFADLVTNVGDIEINTHGRKTNCETTAGNIKVGYENELSQYTVRSSVSYGKIDVDDKSQTGKEFNLQGGDKSIWLKALTGNIAFYNCVTSE